MSETRELTSASLAVSVRRVNGMWRWSVVDVDAKPPASIGEGQRLGCGDAWADVARLLKLMGDGDA